MSLLRTIRGEMAGAWRSVCYDLSRPSAGGPEPRQDVTSTGMNTFPGSLVDLPVSRPETDARPPRRFVAVAAFCALAACGAAGSYAVATTAFADRMTDTAATTVIAPEPPASDDGEDGARAGADRRNKTGGKGRDALGGDAGMGTVPATTRKSRAAKQPSRTPGAATSAAPRAAVPTATASTRASGNSPERGTRPGSGTTPGKADPGCDCETPPVPTPTAPGPGPTPTPDSPSPSGGTGGPAGPAPGSAVDPGPHGSDPAVRGDRHHHWRQP